MSSLYLDPMYILTFLGEPQLWMALSAVLVLMYFVIRYRWYKFRLPLKRFLLVLIPSIAVVLLLSLFFRAVFPVARPCVPCTMIQSICNPFCPANDPSFPSAHAGMAFAAFTSLWLVRRKAPEAVIFILPVAIAYSRVALGVHTWLDIAGGSIIGLAVAIVTWRELRERPLYMGKQHTPTHR